MTLSPCLPASLSPCLPASLSTSLPPCLSATLPALPPRHTEIVPRLPLIDGQSPRRPVSERLAEYSRKPRRVFLGRTNLSRASIYWYIREKQRGAVSSNATLQMIEFQQFFANLRVTPGWPPERTWGESRVRPRKLFVYVGLCVICVVMCYVSLFGLSVAIVL